MSGLRRVGTQTERASVVDIAVVAPDLFQLKGEFEDARAEAVDEIGGGGVGVGRREEEVCGEFHRAIQRHAIEIAVGRCVEEFFTGKCEALRGWRRRDCVRGVPNDVTIACGVAYRS